MSESRALPRAAAKERTKRKPPQRPRRPLPNTWWTAWINLPVLLLWYSAAVVARYPIVVVVVALGMVVMVDRLWLWWRWRRWHRWTGLPVQTVASGAWNSVDVVSAVGFAAYTISIFLLDVTT